MDLHDPAGDLGLDGDDLVRHAPAHRVDVEERVASDGRGHRHGRRWAHEVRLLLLPLACDQREGDDGQPGEPPAGEVTRWQTVHHESCVVDRIRRADATASRGDSGAG